MHEIFCNMNSLPDGLLELLDYEFESYGPDCGGSRLFGFAFCCHGNHVHLFRCYSKNDLEEYDKWKKYVMHGCLYKVISRFH